MNLPFSIGDILERIIPGSAFLAFVFPLLDASIFQNSNLAENIYSNVFLVAALALSASYILGVSFNILAGIFNKKIDKRYIVLDEDHDLSGLKAIKIQEATEDVFDMDWNIEAWRLCYGITTHTNYSTNIELFARLNVFCRSMMVASLLTLASYAVSAIMHLVFFGVKGVPFTVYIFVLIISAFGAYIFSRGAKRYSNAFSSAIYEAFYSWYCNEWRNRKSK